tara:strand:- start:82 stop:261 length:180 start_codon:yes stop_codon:yes gene_type:complete
MASRKVQARVTINGKKLSVKSSHRLKKRAMQKADEYRKKGYSATVYQYGDLYQVHAAKK